MRKTPLAQGKRGRRVLLALSGGVDSSVAGALLLREGCEVEAGFMCNYRDPDPRCSYPQDLRSAVAVAKFLGIPFHEFNFEPAYKKKVLDYFYAEYQAGRTPNPDLLCNKFIKFDLFPKEADRGKFDSVAFGHYARLRHLADGGVQLMRGKDRNKDQSYFLARLKEAQLKRVLFPVGDLKKTKTRQLAREFNLPSRERKDSTGICSVGELDLGGFLKRRIKEKRGPVLNLTGRRVGEHSGVFFYTIGQRHGLNLALGQPHYVVAKELKNNALIVAPIGNETISSKWMEIEDLSWINKAPRLPLRCEIQVRYRQQALQAEVKMEKGKIVARFKEPVGGAARGQFAVLYRGERVLGSGAIALTEGEERALTQAFQG